VVAAYPRFKKSRRAAARIRRRVSCADAWRPLVS